jgi:hypothetical protein
VTRPPPSRTLTTLAFAVVALNAALFAFGALAFGRTWWLIPAVVCAAVAAAIPPAWRRYRRRMAELDATLPEIKRDVDEIRALLRSHHLQN